MYILKNALKCIGRSKGRNLLIGIIVLVIAVSACLGLSIRQAAGSARTEALKGLSVTASISFDRQSAMEGFSPSQGGGEMPDLDSFDKDAFSEMMGSSSALTLEEYEKYATIDTVSGFYYTLSASLNGGEGLSPVSDSTEDENDADTDDTEDTDSNEDDGNDDSFANFPGGNFLGGGFTQMMGMDSDFSIVGYSSDAAMQEWMTTAKISDGEVFAEGTEEMHCIISTELATYNSLSVGDTILLANPNNEEETYELTVVGIYTDSAANEESFSGFGATSTDPANRILMSSATLQSIVDASAEASQTVTDEDTGREFDTALSSSLSATYVFADPDGYHTFEEKVREMGLDESYTVSSSDVDSFESSLTPLNTLSKLATTFLIVILIIGAVILVVLNIFNIRERKYEIGVLTAMGMKKRNVALQFLSEIFVITIIAVMLGATVGGVFSVPVTNALLADQVADQQNQAAQAEQDFGREGNFDFGGGSFGGGGGGFSGMPNMGGGNVGGGGGMPNFGNMGNFANILGGDAETNYVTSVSSAMNITVVWQMLGIGMLLTLVAGAVSMLFVMRYEPLKILANRD